MLISYSKKFIFIHNYKVAGTSVNGALEKYGIKNPSNNDKINIFIENNKNNIVGKLSNLIFRKALNSKFFTHHANSKIVKENLNPKTFESFFKFGFIRNPWDWQVSLYKFMIKRKSHHQHELVINFKGFGDYIDRRINNEIRYQKDFFYSEDGNCLVDFIGKLENLENDFKYICEKIGVNENIPHLNVSNEKNYLEYYNQEMIDKVYEAFKPDIELFGYEKPDLN